MLVETGLDGSVWNFPAGNRNPGLNRDGPDGFLTGFRGGRRPTYRGGLGGAVAPPAKPTESSEMLSWSLRICHLSNSSSPSSKKKFEDFELSWPPREKRLDPFLDLVASE